MHLALKKQNLTIYRNEIMHIPDAGGGIRFLSGKKNYSKTSEVLCYQSQEE
jgi:hypothetical protein